MKKKLPTIAAVGLIASSYTAHAAPITFDFTGSGQLCTYTGGTSESCTAMAFTGAVTIDVLTSVPTGPDAAVTASRWDSVCSAASAANAAK